MYRVRLFATRHSGFFLGVYRAFEAGMVALDPVFRKIGYGRLERPMVFTEKVVKGLLFDCRMCGQCVLSSTGMSCPMNCPKSLRNGPCGGVRPGGYCEVMPTMRCVWVEAWDGATRMQGGLQRIAVEQPPVDRSLEGSSAWLRVAREKALKHRDPRGSRDPGKLAMARAFKRARKIEPAATPLAVEPKAALADQAVAERTSIYDAPSAADKSRDGKP